MLKVAMVALSAVMLYACVDDAILKNETSSVSDDLVGSGSQAVPDSWCGAPCESNDDCTEKVGVGGSTSCGVCRSGLCKGSEP